MNLYLLKKIKFLLNHPKIIIVAGEGKFCAIEAIKKVLTFHKKDISIFEFESEKLSLYQFLIKKSSLPILIVTHTGDIPHNVDFFAGEKEKVNQLKNLSKSLPSFGYIVLNFDDETVRELKKETSAHSLTFGFQERADFQASDIKLNKGTNFKVSYEGDTVPVWLENLFGKEQIYSALAATAVGTILGLNLIEISQALKTYYSLPGKMRLIKGIKNSFILDNSESTSVYSTIEAIEILGKVQEFKRKIVVLGDIIGIGKYAIEAHETIGEKVIQNIDLLFTFGPRAKFIAQTAIQKGMLMEKIYQYDKIEEVIKQLKEKINENDIILINGSKEMLMSKIVKEIAA